MKSRSALGAFVLALSLFALAVGEARADPLRVLVISRGAGDPVTAHLLNELVSLGITVEITPALEGDLAELARARRADAALRVAPSRKAVSLWVDASRRPGAGEALPEQLIHEPPGDPGDAASSLALRAVEILRARLLIIDVARGGKQDQPNEIDDKSSPPVGAAPGAPLSEAQAAPRSAPLPRAVSPAPPPRLSSALFPSAPSNQGGSVEPSSPAAAPARPTRVLTLYITPTVLAHPGGGLSLAGAALGGVRWMFSPRVGGDFMVLAPVVPAFIEAPEGRVRISTTALGAGAFFDLLPRALPVAAGVGVGAAAGFTSYDAEAETPNAKGLDGTIVHALAYGRLTLTWHALPPLGLRLDALTGFTTPRPVFKVYGRDSDAVFGRPMLGLGLGLEMSLP